MSLPPPFRAGATICVSSATGEGDDIAFRIEAKGVSARIAANLPALLAGEAEDGGLDARSIQAYYTGLVARACGLDISISADADMVTIDAKPAAAQAEQPEQEPQSAVA